MPNEPEEPKLIIDEDWKSQVEREKLEAEEKKASSEDAESQSAEVTSVEPETAKASESGTAAEKESTSGREIPPASMPMLVTSLATQAMASMGQIPGDDGKPMPVNLDFARHFIDLIGLLEEKTKGNLDEEESKYLTETLHQLRMMFIAMQSQQSK